MRRSQISQLIQMGSIGISDTTSADSPSDLSILQTNVEKASHVDTSKNSLNKAGGCADAAAVTITSSPLVVVGKGLKLTRYRSVGHGLGSAEQSPCCL